MGRRLPIQAQTLLPGQGGYSHAHREPAEDAGSGHPCYSESAEDQYYTLELCLTPTQLPIFLAQLSGREDVSDSHLQSLIGAVAWNRRESFMPAPTSSDERTKQFETRLGLITAFLDHDPGEPGHGGTAREATTSGAAPPVLLHLALGDTFRESMSVSPMDMDVDADLILGWDWISSHDLDRKSVV